MRDAFIEQLLIEARNNSSIFLIVGDLGFSVVEPFAQEFPDRFLNAGVAEQNMTGIAAGLAKEGFTVFTYSIGNFPVLRCLEQIRNDICYHNLNVKIVSVGGGYAYGSLGVSHHATEELGILRVLPNMVVTAPGDPNEAKAITTCVSKYKGPSYLRLGKAGEPKVHKQEFSINLGGMINVIEGRHTAILTTGAMLKYSYDYIENNKSDWGLYSFPFIKPLDLIGLKNIFDTYEKIITIEEHQKSGGFGSAILEAYNEFDETNRILKQLKIKRIGIPDQFVSEAGNQEYMKIVSSLIIK